MYTSAHAISRSSAARPSSVRRSSATPRLLRLNCSNSQLNSPVSATKPIDMISRSGSPVGRSTFTTSAPHSARIAAADGTKPCSATSSTLTPSSTPLPMLPPRSVPSFARVTRRRAAGDDDPDGDIRLPLGVTPATNGEYIPDPPTPPRPRRRDARRCARADDAARAPGHGPAAVPADRGRRRGGARDDRPRARAARRAAGGVRRRRRRRTRSTTSQPGGSFTVPPPHGGRGVRARARRARRVRRRRAHASRDARRTVDARTRPTPCSSCSAWSPTAPRPNRLECASRAAYLHDLFLASDTTVAMLSDVPNSGPADAPVPFADQLGTQQLAAQLTHGGAPRVLVHNVIAPNFGDLARPPRRDGGRGAHRQGRGVQGVHGVGPRRPRLLARRSRDRAAR